MKASELRIGNWVFNNKDVKVTSGQISMFDEGVYDLKPIPITEQWLLEFGFDKLRDESCVLYLQFSESHFRLVGGVLYYMDYERSKLSEPIKYVHQLQNLYFALTNTELIRNAN